MSRNLVLRDKLKHGPTENVSEIQVTGNKTRMCRAEIFETNFIPICPNNQSTQKEETPSISGLLFQTKIY